MCDVHPVYSSRSFDVVWLYGFLMETLHFLRKAEVGRQLDNKLLKSAPELSAVELRTFEVRAFG